MNLPNKAIREFQKLYFEEYGIVLPEFKAREFAMKLLGLYRIVVAPDEEVL